MSNVLKNVVDLETYSAVYAIISKSARTTLSQRRSRSMRSARNFLNVHAMTRNWSGSFCTPSPARESP